MGRRKISVKTYAEASSEDEENKPVKIKQEVVEESSEESENESISEYEKLRLKNIEERNRLFQSLGFDTALKELKEVTPVRKPVAKKPRQSIVREPLPRREPSRRIRHLAARTEVKIKQEIKQELEEEEDAKDDRLLGSMPMKLENDESKALLEKLKQFKDDIKFESDVDLKTSDSETFQKIMWCLKMRHPLVKVVNKRIQSILVHPTCSKQLVIVGSVSGELGLWDLEYENAIAEFRPHRGPLNCISVSTTDNTKVYTTSHDGAFVCADLEMSIFSNIFATDFHERITHLTWHDQLDANTFLLCHGNGNVGVLDLRDSKTVNTWIPCFERSTRTVQHHPVDDNYFLVSSGYGSSCNVYDRRTCSNKKAETVNELHHPKGLSSAFFSPSGNQVLTTCNDDYVRIYTTPLEPQPKLKKSIPHNNHTGRWLSPFKAMWHPAQEDIFTIGSLLYPRRIQLYGVYGKLIAELKNEEEMTTISPVISAHPTLPLIVGGNSSGRVHAFTYRKD